VNESRVRNPARNPKANMKRAPDDHCEQVSALFLAYSILILSMVAVVLLTQ
jgi:hypothetical protein